MDDSNIKYQRVDWYIVLLNTKGVIADSYQFALVTEESKYVYKSTVTPIEIQQSGKPIRMYGSLTFINDNDSIIFYNALISLVKSSDIIYAQLDRTSNSHHWSDDRVQPDIMLQKTVLGDANQLAILGIN